LNFLNFFYFFKCPRVNRVACHVSNCLMLTKIGTKLNKNNKYKDQIEYRTLTLTHDMLLDWHVDI